MSLRHAILGFLQIMPMTGYELKTHAFDRTVTHFWNAAHQQIYRELNTLAERGWIEYEVEHQAEKPSRKIYHITGAGRAAFATWLRQHRSIVQHREAFLIQLFFAAQLSNEEIIELLEFQRSAHQERLARLQGIYIPSSDAPQAQRAEALTSLTRDLGLRMERMYIDWLTDAIETVRALPE